jgi:succinyl-diaminopimelate desuccinylase
MRKILLPMMLAGLCACECAAAGIDRTFFDALLRLPSRCGDEPELERVVEFTRSWLEKRGVYCVVETNNVGRVALYASVSPGKVQDYLFVSHLDVVAAPDSMFTPRYDGDRVYARGACDTKGNAVVMCQVLANLAGSGASVGMFLATDEDGGRRGQPTAAMMVERGYVPRKMVIVGDSAGEEPGQLFTAEKGHSHIDLVAHGKGGHSSRPWALDNPVPKLCEGYLKFAREWDRGADPKEKWRTVLSPTMLKASDARNAIADEAVMHLSCRYISMADYERAIKMLNELTGLEVRATPGRLPVENRPGDPEIASLLAAMKAKLPGGIREGRMSAATDASYYAATGRPVVIFAADGGEPHCEREWGSLKSLDDYADFFTGYLKR